MILLASVFLALLMGFAVQRGGTCLVAALEEAVNRRRWSRIRALLETSLWVLGGFVLLRAFDRLPMVPMGYPLHWHAALGGALLGIGAFINGGCAFGVVARIGSGQWAWLLTPLGFLAGFALAGKGLGMTSTMPVAIPDWLEQVPIGLAPMIMAALVARLGWLAWNRRNGSADASIWSPHHATIVLGVAFLLLFVCVGAWAYTDILAELASGRYMELGLRGLLLPALFAGALLGGWTAGLWEHRWPTPRALVKCFSGGVLMGLGATLVPGGNDSLILFGMPLLWPNAWLAFACMCVVVVLTLWLARLAAERGV